MCLEACIVDVLRVCAKLGTYCDRQSRKEPLWQKFKDLGRLKQASCFCSKCSSLRQAHRADGNHEKASWLITAKVHIADFLHHFPLDLREKNIASLLLESLMHSTPGYSKCKMQPQVWECDVVRRNFQITPRLCRTRKESNVELTNVAKRVWSLMSAMVTESRSRCYVLQSQTPCD